MACQYHEAEGKDLFDLRAELDELTQLLCTQCKTLDAYGETRLMSEELLLWWESHKEADEQVKAEEERLRRKIAKLQAKLQAKLDDRKRNNQQTSP